MTEKDLLEEIRQMPAIDTHTHFESYMETFGYTMPQFLYNCSYAGVFSGYFEKKDVQLLEDNKADEEEQYEALLRIHHTLRFTRCGGLLEKIAKRMGGELEKESFPFLKKSYEGRTEERVRAMTPAVKGYICNSIGHPMYGGAAGLKKYLETPPDLSPEMHRILNITDLHSITSMKQLQDLERAADQEITALAGWEKACARLISEFAKQGIAGYKDVYLYFRPAQIDLPDAGTAAGEFEQFLKGKAAGKAMLDYMMFRVYEIVSETCLPVAVHTGAVIRTSETARDFPDYMKILKAFPKTSFDLLHLNYPLLDYYMMILKSCPNTYANAAWITSTDMEYTLRYMEAALDAVPVHRTNFFGTDRHCAGEPVAAVLEQSQEVLAKGLYRMIQNGRLSPGDAKEVANMWMYENPKRFYGI